MSSLGQTVALIDPPRRAGPAPVSDAAIVDRIRSGDGAAFEALFRAHWDALYRFAFRYLRSAEEAEDAVQTVFARIWRGRAEWRVHGTVQEYLYVATRNASLDRLKHDRVARSWRERRLGELRADDQPPTEIALEASEIEAAIERALAELPAKRRTICELRFAGHLSYAEIASRLGIAPKTVETQIARGLQLLRVRLRELVP